MLLTRRDVSHAHRSILRNLFRNQELREHERFVRPGVMSLRVSDDDQVSDTRHQHPREAQGKGSEYQQEGPDHEIEHSLPPSSTVLRRRANRPPRELTVSRLLAPPISSAKSDGGTLHGFLGVTMRAESQRKEEERHSPVPTLHARRPDPAHPGVRLHARGPHDLPLRRQVEVYDYGQAEEGPITTSWSACRG